MATILVVDDRPINRDLLVTLLRHGGHRLLEAATGKEALALVRAERPDLVLADILMPTMDGYQFVRHLRDDAEIARTRVVFHTANYFGSEARNLAAACGVRHVVAEPFEPAKLFETVNTVLQDPARAPEPLLTKQFDRKHLQLVSDKLVQKVEELEALNDDLERRVEARTAELAVSNAHLQELNRLKDEFLAIASHDLRSPLHVIRMTADLLLEEGDAVPIPQRREYLDNIVNSAGYLNALVSDLLDLAKIDAGRVRLELQELRAGDIVHRSVNALGFHAELKHIGIELIVAPDEPVVRADPLKLSQIVNNLLSNAIKFTPEGGRIIVAVEPAADGVHLSVTDSGAGIAPEDLSRIFDKFKQARARVTRGEAGTGLGLAIVRQLVELHGGRVEVASEVNRGSTFTVCLPSNHGDEPRARDAAAGSLPSC